MKIVIHLITCFCVVLTVFANDTISSELATTGSIIRLTAVNGTSRVIEAPVAVGAREIVITANDCPSGIYVVNLVVNGAIIGEYRVIKQ